MNIFESMRRKKTLDELQEEDDRLTVEQSIAAKRAAILELRRRGQDPMAFKEGGKFNWQKIFSWLKVH